MAGKADKDIYAAARVLKGKTREAAFTEAMGGHCSADRNSRAGCGKRLEANPYVQKRMAELQALVEKNLMLTAEQVSAALTEIATDKKAGYQARLSALDKIAKTKGMYKETVIEEHRGGVTIDDKRQAMEDWINEVRGDGTTEGTPE